ncbi:hypothetical protein GOP47_0024672 [Adiantum capillus-veneris]|uniref:Exostosin GT47 domain-containing protein n=1 Tax=Adiantum capillus-veneris TaxID=13818 RepID=A0A9D4U331_ADICA|nr:hypothetical protein GOP47_0024672 [Adiantum capillus-veneris]
MLARYIVRLLEKQLHVVSAIASLASTSLKKNQYQRTTPWLYHWDLEEVECVQEGVSYHPPTGPVVEALLPPVLHQGNFEVGSSTVFSGSVSKLSIMDLKEERGVLARPKGGSKEVHVDKSDSLQNYSSAVSNGLINPLGLSNDIKIYIYNLPSSFNTDWLKDDQCSNHLFAAEVAIHQRLLSSPVRTLEPVEADYFFMPVYVSCNFSTTSGFPSLGHARSLLGSAVKLVSRKMPYWNRRKGRDHIFVATHDYGPCFHTMEDVAVTMGIPSFLRNSVILQTFGRTDKHACQTSNSIIIPPFVPPHVLKPDFLPELHHRDIWAFFRGKMEIHPKNVSGRVYSRGVRSTIWQKFGRRRRFFIKRSRSSDYQSEIQRSVFCLCPLGWAPWSPRIAESVIFGCIPVIIADKIALPYAHMINWSKISVTVPEKDVSKLGKILHKVSQTNLSTIQHNLWNIKHRQALLYADPLSRGDATWQVLELLSRKVSSRLQKTVHECPCAVMHSKSAMTTNAAVAYSRFCLHVDCWRLLVDSAVKLLIAWKEQLTL